MPREEKFQGDSNKMSAEPIRREVRQFTRRHPAGVALYLVLWIGLIELGGWTYLDQHPCVVDPASYPWCADPSVQVVRAHPERIDVLAFSQDGETLLSATRHGPDAPRLWDLSGPMRKISEPEAVPGSLTSEPRELQAAAFAPGGSRIITSISVPACRCGHCVSRGSARYLPPCPSGTSRRAARFC